MTKPELIEALTALNVEFKEEETAKELKEKLAIAREAAGLDEDGNPVKAPEAPEPARVDEVLATVGPADKSGVRSAKFMLVSTKGGFVIRDAYGRSLSPVMTNEEEGRRTLQGLGRGL